MLEIGDNLKDVLLALVAVLPSILAYVVGYRHAKLNETARVVRTYTKNNLN